jgi:tartrate-resistant acid phosphatase type 5
LQAKRKKNRWIYISVAVFTILVFIIGGWSALHLNQSLDAKGCFQLPEDLVDIDLPIKESNVRFLAIGDAGTGGEDQRLLAATIKKTCKDIGCDFVLYLGDNFYPHGVNSVSDPLFKHQFEDIYRELELPFFSVLGNHDNQGNSKAQIYYSLKNLKWKMPNFNYGFSAGPVDFFAVNTNCAPSGMSKLHGMISEKPNTWNVVFGHHTIFSSGIHGDTVFLMRQIWKAFFHDQVDFYISGHDHELEHLRIDTTGADYIVSGAGGKHYRNPTDRSAVKSSIAESRFVYQDNGFVWFNAGSRRIEIRYYDSGGQVIYRFTKKK